MNTNDDSEAVINVLQDMCSLCVIERKPCKMFVSLVATLFYMEATCCLSLSLLKILIHNTIKRCEY
jgi:hypothetical protein